MPEKKEALNIIFNLNGVCITDVTSEIYDGKKRSYIAADETKLFFLRKSAILHIQPMGVFKPLLQYVVPGTIELMQLLFSQELCDDVCVSFFGTGTLEINKLQVDALLTKALGAAYYQRIKPQLRIVSSDQCSRSSALEDNIQASIFQINTPPSILKKNLLSLVSKEALPNTILIYNRLSVACLWQEKNILVAPLAILPVFDLVKDSQLPSASAAELAFQQRNSVFYTTGLLMELIAHHQNQHVTLPPKERTPIATKLFDLHFDLTGSWSRTALLLKHQPCVQSLLSTQQYYDKGLVWLKNINPNLTFIDQDSYLACIKDPITPEEKTAMNDGPITTEALVKIPSMWGRSAAV